MLENNRAEGYAPGAIDRAELERIAALAKLNMGRDEDEMAQNLREINAMKAETLDRIFALQLPAEGEASSCVNFGLAQVLREDVAGLSLSRQEVLANAGENVEAGCISVPKILESREVEQP